MDQDKRAATCCRHHLEPLFQPTTLFVWCNDKKIYSDMRCRPLKVGYLTWRRKYPYQPKPVCITHNPHTGCRTQRISSVRPRSVFRVFFCDTRFEKWQVRVDDQNPFFTDALQYFQLEATCRRSVRRLYKMLMSAGCDLSGVRDGWGLYKYDFCLCFTKSFKVCVWFCATRWFQFAAARAHHGLRFN